MDLPTRFQSSKTRLKGVPTKKLHHLKPKKKKRSKNKSQTASTDLNHYYKALCFFPGIETNQSEASNALLRLGSCGKGMGIVYRMLQVKVPMEAKI